MKPALVRVFSCKHKFQFKGKLHEKAKSCWLTPTISYVIPLRSKIFLPFFNNFLSTRVQLRTFDKPIKMSMSKSVTPGNTIFFDQGDESYSVVFQPP